MREIVVLSGKGGTGKTTICAAFAALAKNAIICDLDVDAPDLHILLTPEKRETHAFISGNTALVDESLCIDCGQCLTFCKFDAIKNNDGYCVDDIACEGCGVCVTLCPTKAFLFPQRHCGEWYISQTPFAPMVHAQLKPGQENSGRLVSLLKEKARAMNKETPFDVMLCDGSPGIGCPVISSLSGAHLAVIVVEPTVSGLHDFERIANLAKHFRIPMAVIINKATLNQTLSDKIAEMANHFDAQIVASLPFTAEVPRAMIAKKILSQTQTDIAMELKKAWSRIIELSSVGATKTRRHIISIQSLHQQNH